MTGGGRAGEGEVGQWMHRQGQCIRSGLDDGGARASGQPPGAGKGEGMNPVLEPPQRNTVR